MKRAAERRAALACALVVCTITGACGRFLDYPNPRLENDGTRCHNGIDDDLDGKTDCEDPDCNGVCSEETVTECGDGRDNDGDGLADAADPRCWLLYPPSAQRCGAAAGVEIFNNFDAEPVLGGVNSNQPYIRSEWTFWGHRGLSPVVGRRPHPGPERRDLLVAFEGNTTGADALVSNLGSYVRQLPFSGNWKDFELTFSAFVPPRAILRAGIVPVGLAPAGSAPLAGAESRLFSVALDASVAPPVLTLDVEGQRRETELPPMAATCDGTAPVDCMGKLSVSLDDEGLRAEFVAASGAASEVRTFAPSSLSLPPSRLVFWGGSAEGAHGARLDDLRLSLKPEFPCGFQVPQISRIYCRAPFEHTGYGYSVSIARGRDGQYCALAVASGWDEANARLEAPTFLSTWHSLAGTEWTPTSSIEAPLAGATLVGAGVAADSSGWHVVMAHRDDAEGGVRLSYADGSNCQSWGNRSFGPLLPGDAEAPSYLVAGDRHEVYFTRPPLGDAARTLWRVLRTSSATEPEYISALPLSVEAPVALQRAGTKDVVLTAPSRAGSRGRGVEILVSNETLTEWRPVGPGPVLTLPETIDLPSGWGRLAFDDREVISAALSLDHERGILFYGGRSTEGAFGTGDFGTPILTVGTANVLTAGESLLDDAVVPSDACGDGTCADSEDCVRCASDCPCPGLDLLSDPLRDGARWETISSVSNPTAHQYFHSDPPALSYIGGAASWSALPLERALTGDFELSFDVLVELADDYGGFVEVGVGTRPDTTRNAPFEELAPDSAIFASVTACAWTFSSVPRALIQGTLFRETTRDGAFCYDSHSQLQGAWQHVVLRREGSRISVLTPNQAFTWLSGGRRTCSTAETSVTYAGAMPALTHLLVGSDGPSILNASGSPGTIKNLKLRLLEDPGECSESKLVCSDGSDEPSCVDTSRSAEHCGACGARCEEFETCQGGTCACSVVSGFLVCDGTCIDPNTSVEHCGGCNQACVEQCVASRCDPILVGDCAAPFVIPPDGGSLPLGFPSESVPSGFSCDGYSRYVDELVGAWTPSSSGAAVIEVDVGEHDVNAEFVLDSVLGITEDTSCATWLACNDDIVLLEKLGSTLTVQVEAGRTYRILVALWDYRPPGLQSVELRVRLE